jgi:hypothetical protein
MILKAVGRLALRRAAELYSEALVTLAGNTLSDDLMSKLLCYEGYDTQQQDFFIEGHGRRWYRAQLGQGRSGQPREPRPIMELSQINNLLGVTLETSSPTVVTNWVRYQMGRKETREAWGGTGLGKQVVADINKIKNDMASEVARAAFSDQVGDQHIQMAHITLVRLYAGYLKRWFVAKGGQK